MIRVRVRECACSARDARAAHGDALHHGAVTRHALLLLLAGTLQPPHRDLGVDEHAGHGAVLLHGEGVNAARACALGLRYVDGPAVLIVIDPVAVQGGADKQAPHLSHCHLMFMDFNRLQDVAIT